jgi:hypothetical protein
MISNIWVLILFFHVGPISNGNSNATTTQEFYSQSACTTAGAAAKGMVKGTVKSLEFVCVQK